MPEVSKLYRTSFCETCESKAESPCWRFSLFISNIHLSSGVPYKKIPHSHWLLQFSYNIQTADLSVEIQIKRKRVIPILLIELQHHVVRGDAQRPSALVVLLAIQLIHIWRRHWAVVGVVVGVDRAAVVAGDIKLDFCERWKMKGNSERRNSSS